MKNQKRFKVTVGGQFADASDHTSICMPGLRQHFCLPRKVRFVWLCVSEEPDKEGLLLQRIHLHEDNGFPWFYLATDDGEYDSWSISRVHHSIQGLIPREYVHRLWLTVEYE